MINVKSNVYLQIRRDNCLLFSANNCFTSVINLLVLFSKEPKNNWLTAIDIDNLYFQSI
jgi:hypothetical protein